MELKIGGKTYPLTFGLAFLREMDKRHEADAGGSGLTFGFGVLSAIVALTQRNPLILVDIIQSATITEKSKPSVGEIETFLEEYKDLETLFEDFLSAFENAPLIACQLKQFRK